MKEDVGESQLKIENAQQSLKVEIVEEKVDNQFDLSRKSLNSKSSRSTIFKNSKKIFWILNLKSILVSMIVSMKEYHKLKI